MSDGLMRFRMLVLGVGFIVTALLAVLPYLEGGLPAELLSATREPYLTVAFLDVGQGDAIYIETPDGVQLLIDGGPDGTVLRELPLVMPWWDRRIDMILATHPDKDHIGGLVDVLTRYEVGKIIRTENESDTAVASAFSFMSAEEVGAITHLARAGDMIQLGASTTLTVYSPASDPTTWESNNASIVTKLTYGEIDFMLTGDASVGTEEWMVDEYGGLLASEVLKLGHHGSRTSTADNFLDTVHPTYAIVSAGADNRYGHPHEEVMAKVQARNIQLLDTLGGAVVFRSDGERVWLE
jgi:competence protein ComEC